MSQRTFISFLGTGNYNQVRYAFPDGRAITTRYVQRAILEWCGVDSFDRVLVLMTSQSSEKHWKPLNAELLEAGVPPERLRSDDSIRADQGEAAQWSWFDRLIEHIPEGSEVVFDFTHGFRSVPIVFSTAISYLRKARGIRLRHAFYGYQVELGSPDGIMVEMTRFYRINDWADAVARLIEAADAGPLAELAVDEPEASSFHALQDQELIAAIRRLNQAVKDIHVDAVGEAAREALTRIRSRLDGTDAADQHLLRMILDKFGQLGDQLETDTYDRAYFEIQLGLAEMLLEHELHMQAFTVLREYVASLAMLGVTGKYAKPRRQSKDGRKYRKQFGDRFVRMCDNLEEKWEWTSDCDKSRVEHLTPYWEALKEAGIAQRLQVLVPRLTKIRNAFDHAWVGKGPDAIAKLGEPAVVGREVLDELQELLPAMLEIGEGLRAAHR